MKRVGFLLLLCLTFCPSTLQAQSLSLPASVQAEPRDQVFLVPKILDKDEDGNPKKLEVLWKIDPALTDETAKLEALFGAKAAGKVLRAPKASGRYKVQAWVEGDIKKPLDRTILLNLLGDPTLTDKERVEQAQALAQGASVTWVIVGTPDPEPVPDGKDKKPKPPVPTPKEFRVAVVYETAQKLTGAQSAILNAEEFIVYLNSKAVKDEKGRPSWRVFDQHVPMTKETPFWQGVYAKAIKDAAGQYPWIMIGDGETGVSQRLPNTLAETMALLRKYGG